MNKKKKTEGCQEGFQGPGSTNQRSGSTGSVLLHSPHVDQPRQIKEDPQDEFWTLSLVPPAELWGF